MVCVTVVSHSGMLMSTCASNIVDAYQHCTLQVLATDTERAAAAIVAGIQTNAPILVVLVYWTDRRARAEHVH